MSISAFGVSSSELFFASALNLAETPKGALSMLSTLVSSNVIGLVVPDLFMYSFSLNRLKSIWSSWEIGAMV